MGPKMRVVLGVEKVCTVGTSVALASTHPSTGFGVSFEDDGEAAYFYATEPSRPADDPIVDALLIYNVDGVTDRHLPSKFQIVWSQDGTKSALVVNGTMHAIFDFVAKRGYCRSAYPPPNSEWTKHSHQWDENAMWLFC